ncbi:MAG: DUF1559 domain-containing protein, partial [Planctomycetota bacterium]
AVQAAREAARRAQCQNNLKQNALAVINFTDIKKRYPIGVEGGKPGAIPSNLLGEEGSGAGFCDKGVGWVSKILPQLDQQPLYEIFFDDTGLNLRDGDKFPFPNLLQFGPAILGTQVWRGGDTVLPSFRCPSSELPDHAEDCTPTHVNGYATADYKGSNGFADEGIFSHLCDRAKASSGDGLVINYVRPENVEDGTSNTLMIGESSYYVRTRAQEGGEGNTDWPTWVGGIWSDEHTLFKTARDAPINCGVSPKSLDNLYSGTKPGIDITQQNPGPMDDDCAFSWHQGGAFFGYCDGSVHWLDEDIEFDIYRRLGQRNDGEIIPDF